MRPRNFPIVRVTISTIALADLEAGRLVSPFDMTTPSSFSYSLVHPASKSRSAAVKAFRKWLREESAATAGAQQMGFVAAP
jgi:LysR family glycine cleavage system transcriptional activator